MQNDPVIIEMPYMSYHMDFFAQHLFCPCAPLTWLIDLENLAVFHSNKTCFIWFYSFHLVKTQMFRVYVQFPRMPYSTQGLTFVSSLFIARPHFWTWPSTFLDLVLFVTSVVSVVSVGFHDFSPRIPGYSECLDRQPPRRKMLGLVFWVPPTDPDSAPG